jgi:hypothetical protein
MVMIIPRSLTVKSEKGKCGKGRHVPVHVITFSMVIMYSNTNFTKNEINKDITSYFLSRMLIMK